jgi:VCBS repeat protein/all-beta uncharacterized protein
MSLLPRRTLISGLLLIGLAVPALAQSTREEWLALRTRKQARHHRLPSLATQPKAFTITTIRFFSDASGNLVGVGEARNDTPYDLSYSRINFKFLNAAGAEIARDWTYLHGGVNARIVGNSAYELLLVPGATGFFKIWTTIPASSMASYSVETAGENLPYANPRAVFYRWEVRPERWLARVFTLGTPRVVDQRITGDVWNDDPLSFQGPSGLDDILTYDIQVSVATYQDGEITDVHSVTAVGRAPVEPCRGEPVTGMHLHQPASFGIDLTRQANRVGRYSIEWRETVVTPGALGFPTSIGFVGSGGEADFTVWRECGWTARSVTPWIAIVNGAASSATSGKVTVDLQPNPTSTERSGAIVVSGETFNVVQGSSCHLVFNPSYFIGSGHQSLVPLSGAPRSCLLGVRTDSLWLTPFVYGDSIAAIAGPNLTGATRSAVVTIGAASFTVYQAPASRNADFNGDGHLDLLWRHRDGWIAVWRMNGLQMIDGTLLSPPRWERQGMVPVAAADLDFGGSTDILWQNDTTGAPSLWHMTGTAVAATNEVEFNGVTTSSQKIRAVADFNRDGGPDFVWQDGATGSIFIWLMDPAFSQWYPMEQRESAPLGPGVVADLNWKIAGSGDFNRDGWPDVVWQHETDGRIVIWTMQGTSLIAGVPFSPGRVADLTWKIRAVGDMNGDDMPDLIWQHRVDGRVAVWLMDGTRMTSAVVIAQLADTNWEIVGPR